MVEHPGAQRALQLHVQRPGGGRWKQGRQGLPWPLLREPRRYGMPCEERRIARTADHTSDSTPPVSAAIQGTTTHVVSVTTAWANPSAWVRLRNSSTSFWGVGPR